MVSFYTICTRCAFLAAIFKTRNGESGNGEWERGMGTGNGNGEWQRRMATGNGNGNGNGQWERGMGMGTGNGNGSNKVNGNHQKTSFKKRISSLYVCMVKKYNLYFVGLTDRKLCGYKVQIIKKRML